MSKTFFLVLLLLGFNIVATCQQGGNHLKLSVNYIIQDSSITFDIIIKNLTSDSIGIYKKDPFYYCDKQPGPNCFSVLKEINMEYYNLYPVGSIPHRYNGRIYFIPKNTSCKVEFSLPLKQLFSPIDSGNYSIIFQMEYLYQKVEGKILSETIYFKAP